MDNLIILENLFEEHDDQIHFGLFKESNIIAHNINNQGNFNKEINFNTQSLASHTKHKTRAKNNTTIIIYKKII